ncbi:bifunctional 2-polyprenyl-6-hydroxyphenol methylase/3-demethylubiquinol 3-O-methyltransferase UbiG [uncultured Mitsuokella sp.]|uniref:class I SAM-dependent methyltransferase n=1 Tax=uncultured Mitsuokella sp. TaxID=453120 RepID=UPI0025CE7C4B|nr:class I SAM-dependent methyltransferase [uncultured Mitsuokella sp.]
MIYTNKTLQYYNRKASSFVQETVDVEFSALQNEFISKIRKGGRILDLGCGSGRDSKAFLSQGFDVVSIDGSEKMAELASEYIGQSVICSTFQDYQPEEKFDGIWACASLLHLTKEDIVSVIQKMTDVLNTGGIFYVSFKYGDFSGERNGRFFTDLNERSFGALIAKIPKLKIQHQYITNDARPRRSAEKWLNVFLVKC